MRPSASGALRYVHDCSEGRSIANGEVSQHFPVNGNVVALQAGDKDRVRKSIQSSGSVHAVDPELTHLALTLLSIACGVRKRVEEGFARRPNKFGSRAATAGGSLKQALMTLMPSYAPLYTCHALSPRLIQPP